MGEKIARRGKGNPFPSLSSQLFHHFPKRRACSQATHFLTLPAGLTSRLFAALEDGVRRTYHFYWNFTVLLSSVKFAVNLSSFKLILSASPL